MKMIINVRPLREDEMPRDGYETSSVGESPYQYKIEGTTGRETDDRVLLSCVLTQAFFRGPYKNIELTLNEFK